MTYYHLPPFIYTKNHFFQSHKMSFSALVASIGQQVLTKRSTHVDQNVRSDKVMSQLSLAIFVTSRTHLVVQKSLIYEKSPKMDESMQPTRYFIKKRVKMVDFVLTFFFICWFWGLGVEYATMRFIKNFRIPQNMFWTFSERFWTNIDDFR